MVEGAWQGVQVSGVELAYLLVESGNIQLRTVILSLVQNFKPFD